MLKTYPNPVLTRFQAEQALDTAVALVREQPVDLRLLARRDLAEL